MSGRARRAARSAYRSLLAAAWVATAAAGPAVGAVDGPASTVAGKAIYREGLLPTGGPLEGRRPSDADVAGRAAACENCHRRSGLGYVEGDILIPPITAKYLYRRGVTNTRDLTMTHLIGVAPRAGAYDDASLARLIRTGIRPDGRALNPVMPRYALDGSSMTALLDYLKTLGNRAPRGVTSTTLDFATIVTPDADPIKKKAMLSVLERFFAGQNRIIAAEFRPMHASREIMYRVTRQWRLHVWQLTGPAQAWDRELRDHLTAEPVFAVISGLGGRDWAPVHRFCERERVPCVLPNVDLPVVQERDFYPVYYSRGVLLEADLIASRLFSAGTPHPRRLVEIYRRADIGGAAAAALARAAKQAGVAVDRRELPAATTGRAGGAEPLRTALAGVGRDDALALWLRPRDLAGLGGVPPTPRVYFSGLMGGLESAPLPVRWRPAALETYPVDTPERRRVRMDFPLGWLHVQNIPVTAERVQTDTYYSCVILAEALGHMLDSFVPEYLVERLEMTLGLRVVNGYYPRLSLAPGQRFASKGGYLVHLSDATPGGVVPVSAWLTP